MTTTTSSRAGVEGAPHPVRRRFARHALLGTVIEVAVEAEFTQAERVANRVFDVIARLQKVFSRFDDQSELRRYRRGEVEPGAGLTEVLSLAEQWRLLSDGAFDVRTVVLSGLWADAAAAGRVPADGEIAAALTATGLERQYDLGGIAKGWIIDRAARAASADGQLVGLTVNAGGDLLHRGTDPIVVGIEDPRRPYDNVRPPRRVLLDNMALATSGDSRRGWIIQGSRYSHIFDPRTGWPQRGVRSASVIAHDAATADVLATILTIVGSDEGLALCAQAAAGCLVIDMDGNARCNPFWAAAEETAAASKESASAEHSQSLPST